MAGSEGAGEEPLSPTEAFSLLGDATRVGILQALATAGEPLSFSALRERVGTADSGQFSYHLRKLVGHFVHKGEAGYELRAAGERVVQAVLSGAVTRDPVVERSRIDEWPCPYCGAAVEVAFREERVERYCTECEGLYGADPDREQGPDRGSLGALYLPPAGVADRTPAELLRAAFTWAYAEWLIAANGVCPRCAAAVDREVTVCEEHDPAPTACRSCGHRKAVRFRSTCPNCTFGLGSIASMHLAASTEMLAFTTARGINPLGDNWGWGWEYEEEVLSTDPFEGRFTFSLEGDEITLLVDEHLDVVEATVSEGTG